MKCPNCSGDTHVVDSRYMVNGLWRRRRACLSCKYRFTTVEVPIEQYGKMEPYDREAIWKAVDKGIASLKADLKKALNG